MSGWTLADTHSTRGRTFQRPLDPLELCFIWDGLFNGTADTLHHYELALSHGSQDAKLFSEANIIRAWMSTKRRYPLVGAAVRGADGAPLQLKVATASDADIATGFASHPHFVVQERNLTVLRSHEIVFRQVASAEEAQRQAAAILNGPRPLSEELLVQPYVFRESNPRGCNAVHLMMLSAHCVTDVMAGKTLARCFLDTLARSGENEPAHIPLEERLAMAVPPMDLEPEHLHSLSPARRRWRRAIGMVVFQLKMQRRQGGHTLPCRITRSTPDSAAKSGLVSTWLTDAQTITVIANCRSHGFTFGNVYLALAQVAMTRVLYRRYLRGEISEKEWDHRKRQPHISGGPLNLRPYLDKAWFERGGGGEAVVSLGLFYYQLPFMALGATTEQDQPISSDGAPPFSKLLTFDRFLHRAGLVKKQATAFFDHPLFFEIVHAASLARNQRLRRGALQRMQRAKTVNGCDTDHGEEDEVLAVADMPLVWAHAGSSLGNMDFISPSEYPLSPTHPLSPYSSDSHPVKAGYVASPLLVPSASEADTKPRIVVESYTLRLHMRPAQLSLSASTSRGRMCLYVFFDENVFKEGVVREWLDEVKEAVLWYLGQTHQSSCRPQRIRDDASDDI